MPFEGEENMISRTLRFFPLNVMAVLLMISCAGQPKPAALASAVPQGPGQDLLDELDAAMARAQNGREGALAVQAQAYFPDEWNKAESDNNSGRNANKSTVEGVKQGIALFASAAGGYEAIAANSGSLFAKDQEDANSALQAAMARAEKSRKDAHDSLALNYFPDDWAGAEALRQNSLDANKNSIEEMKTAAALFVSAADSYDAITSKNRQIIAKEKEDADKALQAAMAQTEKSRQAAMNVSGQAYFPNDWRAAEAKNTSAKGAKKTTAEEIKTATAQFISATAAYDDIAARSQQMAAKEKEDANKTLLAAIARMEKSRKDAQDAKANINLPVDWNNAEAKNRTAVNARRATAIEMKAAVPLYNSAADAYDDLVRKNLAFQNTQNQKSAEDAKARAEKERQKALDVQANIAAVAEFGGADAIFKQAAADFNKKIFTSAIESYNKSSDQFIAAALSAEKKRVLADNTIGEAKRRSAQSADYAVNTGTVMEEKK
jgi:hypothetical protein